MTISKKRLVAYSYLATINELQSGEEIIDIFVEFVKPVFCSLFKENVRAGQVKDIKDRFDNNYDLNTPYPVLKSILDKLGCQLSKVEFPRLIFNTDYSFQVRENPFPDLDEEMIIIDRELDILHNAFVDYVKENSNIPASKLNIFEYIEANKLEFCAYFSSSRPLSAGTDSQEALVCCDFINSIRSNSKLFTPLQRIYTGSIISTYLELPAQNLRPSKTTFVVDTNFVMSYLNLQSEASYHTTTTLVDICKKQGHQFIILDITIQEVYNLICRFFK